jgi:hypothetical protein
MAHHCRETAQMVGRPAHLPAFASYAGDIEADISAARKCIARPNAQKKGQPGMQGKKKQEPKKGKTVVNASLAASSGARPNAQKTGQPGNQRKRKEQTPAAGQGEPAPKKGKIVVEASLAASSGVPGDIQPGVWTLRRMWARGVAKTRCKGIGCKAQFFKGAPPA